MDEVKEIWKPVLGHEGLYGVLGKTIAKIYHVSAPEVSCIKRGVNWGWLKAA